MAFLNKFGERGVSHEFFVLKAHLFNNNLYIIYIMEKNKFICEHCNYKTNRTSNLKRHQNAKHNQNIENEEISEIAGLNSEITTINPEITGLNSEITSKKKKEPLYCKRCNKKYMNKQYLEEHIKKCKLIDSLTCPSCMHQFFTYGNKSRHIKRNNCKAKSIIHAITLTEKKNETKLCKTIKSSFSPISVNDNIKVANYNLTARKRFVVFVLYDLFYTFQVFHYFSYSIQISFEYFYNHSYHD